MSAVLLRRPADQGCMHNSTEQIIIHRSVDMTDPVYDSTRLFIPCLQACCFLFTVCEAFFHTASLLKPPGIIDIEHRLSFLQRLLHVQDTLVLGAAEGNGDVLLLLNERPVHQDIQV